MSYFEGVRRVPGLPSAELDGTSRRFRNLRFAPPVSLWSMLKFLAGSRPVGVQLPVRSDTLSNMRAFLAGRSTSVTWIGHATFLVQLDNGISFLTDPVFEDRCSPVSFFGPKRLVPPAVPIESINNKSGGVNVDFVIISHNHYDHLSNHAVSSLGDDVFWFVPLGLEAFMHASGVRRVKVRSYSCTPSGTCVRVLTPTRATPRQELDWGEQACFKRDDGAVAIVTCLPCQVCA